MLNHCSVMTRYNLNDFQKSYTTIRLFITVTIQIGLGLNIRWFSFIGHEPDRNIKIHLIGFIKHAKGFLYILMALNTIISVAPNCFNDNFHISRDVFK